MPTNVGTGREERGDGPADGAVEGAEKGRGQEKVTVCHNGKKALPVGAPARDAHLRYGDTVGACG